jgi:hypothetical protein
LLPFAPEWTHYDANAGATLIEALIGGLALAATAGLRLFLPFLFVGGMARYGGTPTPDMLSWTATDTGFLLLLTAALAEILSDKIPVVDHILDVGATFIKPAAGLILPVALLQDASPALAWTLGIAAGAPLALGVHTTKAGTRAASTGATAGFGNPIISAVEDLVAMVLLAFTALAPFLAALLVIGLVIVVIRAWRRMRRFLDRGSTRDPALPPA